MNPKLIAILILVSALSLQIYAQTACPKNCKVCSTSTTCTSCEITYYLDIDATCKPCKNGCKNCTAPVVGSTLGPVCRQCLPNFNLNMTLNQCFNCDVSCLACSGWPTNCTSCIQGMNYTIDNTMVGRCQRDVNCLNSLCKDCRPGSNNLCQSCKSGYYLKSDGSCNKCQYPCLNCQFDINPTAVIQQFKAGMAQVDKFVNTYNAYLDQLQNFFTLYMNWYVAKMFDPTLTLQSTIPANANFSLLGAPQNFESLNLSSPNFTQIIFNMYQNFQIFIDESFVRNLDTKIQLNTQQFKTSYNFQNLGNSSTNRNFSGPNLGNNSGNYSNFFGNNSDLFGNYSNFFGNMSNFGNFSDFFGNMSNNGNFSDFFANMSNFGNFSDFFGNMSNYGNDSNFFSNFTRRRLQYANQSSNFTDMFGNYSNFFGNNSIGNNSNPWGNFSFNIQVTTGDRLSMQFFLKFLFNQTSFRRYFKGTYLQLIGGEPFQYFNFDSAPASCRGCILGFFFTAATNDCTNCQPNCEDCSSATTCSKCVAGYTNAGSGDRICLKCAPPCLRCESSITSCTQCVPPFKLTSANTCILCASPCLTCDPSNSTKCINCMVPFSRLADANGKCFACKQGICRTCLASNTSICIQCANGTSLVDGQCQLCPKKCLDCSSSAATPECYKCQQRFVVDITSKLCVPCGQGCLVCKQQNPQFCITCQSGTYRNETGFCKLCNQACSQCTDSISCTTYKGGRTMVGGEIVQCRKGCKKCNNQNLQLCLECQQRFALNGSVCLKCQQGCQGCDSSNIRICTSCPNDRVLASGSCIACPRNCTTCTSPTSCTACRMGFILNNSSCIDAKTACPTGCLNCNATACSQCSLGYVLALSGKCVKCVSSCGGSCDSSNPLLCTGCTNGFESIQGKCVRCPLNCQTCSNGACSKCKDGFKLFQNSTGTFCQRQCIYPCKTCTQITCLSCATNFTMTNGRCEPDLTCGGQGCLFCPIGSYKDTDGLCQKCITNCVSCTNSTFCLACGQGYYANSAGSCINCPQGTAVCMDSVTSVVCKAGYIKEAVSMSSDSTDLSSATVDQTCQPCKSPCKECLILRSLCVSCISDQYRLNGTSCLKKLVVGVQIKFDYNFTNFLSEGALQSIIDTLSTKVTATIIVTFLRQGSVVVGVAASPDSGSSASAVAGSVNGAINSGFGIPIVGSSVGLFLQDATYTQPSNSQNKVGMIVGIAIGGVIFVVIIGLIIYKVKKSKQAVRIAMDSNGQTVKIPQNENNGPENNWVTNSFRETKGQGFVQAPSHVNLQNQKVLFS